MALYASREGAIYQSYDDYVGSSGLYDGYDEYQDKPTAGMQVQNETHKCLDFESQKYDFVKQC
jgi:hypothetical protein